MKITIEKIIRGCSIGCGTVVVLFLLTIFGGYWYVTRGERIAQDPEDIADEAGWELPDGYKIQEDFNNMERNASTWSEYDYNVTIPALSSKQTEELNTLVKEDRSWTYKKDTGEYVCMKQTDDCDITIVVNPKKHTVYLACMWEDFFA